MTRFQDIFRSVIVGAGGYLPERVVSNHDLAQFVDTSHEWIVERTGIHQRYFVGEGQMTSDLGAEAAKIALKNAGLSPQEIDLIVVGTATPDKTFPSTATRVCF
jgi:3-oxoacyl-[acyl-carrier-protein] synthase-3